MLPKVLVTDASERAALAVIRSLGRRGIDVTAADSTSFNSGFLSKYCSHRVIYPAPHKNKRKFVDSMLRFVKNENFDLLIPITDFTAIPILEYEDEIEDYVKIAIPPYETAIKAIDKAQTIKIAQQHGIPCPKTFLVEDSDNLKEIAKDLRHPVVIKPRVKVLWTKERAIMLKVTHRNYAYNRDDLMAKYVKISSQLDGFDIPQNFFLIQELAGGEGHGVEVLMQNSEPKALFIHKRLREYPITGGASTLRVSVRNERLKKYAVNLLSAMNWEGVAMVEFKLNEESGDVNLMEVNGRFWGSLPLAINAGIDFPYLLYRSFVEKNVDQCFSYRVGAMQRWLIPGDLLWLFASLHDNQRSKLRNFMEFTRSWRVSDDIVSLSDMAPTFGAMLTTLRYFFDVIRGNRTIHGESGLTEA